MSDVSGERPTVLVVDDEEDLRDIMRRMLERRGFATLVAGDVDQALAACREHGSAIDVLVTDLNLPGTTGADLGRAVGTLCPDVRVIYISGLPKDIAVSKGLIEQNALLVKKPFTANTLIEALTSALAEQPTH
jgi:DNA-binding NtrC family response regulator